MTDDEQPTTETDTTGICDGCDSLADLLPVIEDGVMLLLCEWCR
ncbi:hypothetical protein [Terrabacter tumescens]|nr:hypothetical protein [Terrabacter tumescens]